MADRYRGPQPWEVDVSKFWVQVDGNIYCAEGDIPTCGRAKLQNPSAQRSDLLGQLQEATDRINAVLEETSSRSKAADAGLEIAFLLIRNPGGEDQFRLGYIDTRTKVTTYFC